MKLQFWIGVLAVMLGWQPVPARVVIPTDGPQTGLRQIPLNIFTHTGPVRFTVEVAENWDEQEHGMMFRRSVGPQAGMIFPVRPVHSASFWMKNTLIPLSIAFWDEDGRIVGIRDMDPCTADPCPTYGSPDPYVGALEVDQGFFTEHGVVIGDRIELS